MAIFDYKGHDAGAEVTEAFALARYSQVKAFGVLGDASGVLTGTSADLAPPAGWRDLTATELCIDPAKLDVLGFFVGSTSSSPQTKIMAFTGSDGSIERIAVAFAGTSDIGDLPDYFSLAKGAYIDQFRYALDAAATLAKEHGLSGADVVVTGYSLGGGAANVLAERSGEISGGFYETANFFGFSSPNIYDNAEKILNFGGENDLVYRSLGTSTESIPAGLTEAIVHKDRPFDSSIDNTVLFNDLYADPLSPFGPDSVFNIAGGWNAHVSNLFSNAVGTIAKSSFASIMEKDSAIVVSQLSDLLRPFVWVEDAKRSTSSHFGEPAFILGSEKADLLRDGRLDDFLDGFGGNDRFSLSTGNDVVSGGLGSDTAELAGKASDYDALQLSDGTLVLQGRSGAGGLKELTSVERVTFGSGLAGSTYEVLSSKLDGVGFLASDKSYVAHREGTTGADTMLGTGGIDRLFGMNGNDVIRGGGGNDLLHGGAGNDKLFGEAGNDVLLGGIGNDVLVGGAGNDRLSGGIGDDVFDFSRGAGGRDVVTDFDAGVESHDTLVLNATLFNSFEATISKFQQVGSDAVLSWFGGSVVLENYEVARLHAGDILFV